MIRLIMLLGHPALRASCPEVQFPGDCEFRATTTDLLDTLRDFRSRNGFGRGLAAPQIGVLKRIVAVIEPQELLVVNPIIVKSEGRQVVWDDCFSLPGIMVRVSRAETITVTFKNELGSVRESTASGNLSELLQHEIDHLEGTVILDYAADSSQVMMREEWQRQTEMGLLDQDTTGPM